MSSRRVICFGEALIDVFPDRREVAGAPLHVAAHLASFGWDSRFVTRLGTDEDGRTIRAELERLGVDVSHVEEDPSLATGTTIITLDADGHDFTITRPVAWDAIDGPGSPGEADVVYFGTLAMRDHRSRAALDGLLAVCTGTRAVDLNLRAPDFDHATLRRAITAADLLKLSTEEWAAVSELLDVGGAPDALHNLGPEWVCLTKGPDGADLMRRDGGFWSVPAIRVEVVDSVGAGDAFCAGLIDGLLPDGDPEDALHRATVAAAATLGRRGGLPGNGNRLS